MSGTCKSANEVYASLEILIGIVVLESESIFRHAAATGARRAGDGAPTDTLNTVTSEGISEGIGNKARNQREGSQFRNQANGITRGLIAVPDPIAGIPDQAETPVQGRSSDLKGSEICYDVHPEALSRELRTARLVGVNLSFAGIVGNCVPEKTEDGVAEPPFRFHIHVVIHDQAGLEAHEERLEIRAVLA